MLQFASIFKNHFNTEKISDDSFKKFVEEHLQKSIAKNGGGTFTIMITDTTMRTPLTSATCPAKTLLLPFSNRLRK